MSPTNQRIDVTLETRLESITESENICVRAAASAGFDEDECYRISVAVREGVINAFHWGNKEQPGKKIRLSFEVANGRFMVHIIDQGSGFEPAEVLDPLADENLLNVSGRGILLMRAFMDEWDVGRSSEGGAELVMAKRLPGASSAGSAHGG
jgi:anti-sigma regulatory factor (Ser/Thr protein kinase)